MLEFQSVVMAGGRGSRLPAVGQGICKCLLPIGPYPALYYSLQALENMGFQDTMVIVLDQDKSNILNALEKCPLNIKYDIIAIPSDEDWGTADSLRHISSRVVADLFVLSGDLITNLDFTEVVNLYRKHNASVVSIFFNNGPEEYIELPGPKTKVKPDRDFVGIDAETQRLVLLASASDFEEEFTIPRAMVKKYDSVCVHTRLLDAHVYIVKKWIINYLVDENKFSTIKGELIPHIVKKQLSKPKKIEKKGTSEKQVQVTKDIYSYAEETGYEEMIRKLSLYNDHELCNREPYNGDVVRCYAFIPDKKYFGMRINTLSSFYLVNSKIMEKWSELTLAPVPQRVSPEASVLTKQIDELSSVGDKSAVAEKTSIKRTCIGSRCVVENKVRLSNCIIMNNVTIKEGCVLQDCVIYTGATIESGTSLQHCLVGSHHVLAKCSGQHQIYTETTDDMITLGT